MLADNKTARKLLYTIIFIVLLIPMIVLLLKLECKHKNETKGEVESNEFTKYLFNNKSPMHKGFYASISALTIPIFIYLFYEFYYLNREKKKNQ